MEWMASITPGNLKICGCRVTQERTCESKLREIGRVLTMITTPNRKNALHTVLIEATRKNF